MLQVLNEKLDAGLVLIKTLAPTEFGMSIARNSVAPYIASEPFVIAKLHQLARAGVGGRARQRAGRSPTTRAARRSIARRAWRSSRDFIGRELAGKVSRRLTGGIGGGYWRIAIRRSGDAGTRPWQGDWSDFRWCGREGDFLCRSAIDRARGADMAVLRALRLCEVQGQHQLRGNSRRRDAGRDTDRAGSAVSSVDAVRVPARRGDLHDPRIVCGETDRSVSRGRVSAPLEVRPYAARQAGDRHGHASWWRTVASISSRASGKETRRIPTCSCSGRQDCASRGSCIRPIRSRSTLATRAMRAESSRSVASTIVRARI